jgi:hypothetical protein
MENNINKNVDDGLEIHEFSEEYRQHKEKMIAGLKELEKNDSIENSHSSAVRGKILNRSVKIAAAVLICVVLVPVTIHAAVNLYKMTVTRDGVDLKVDIGINDGIATGSDALIAETTEKETYDPKKAKYGYLDEGDEVYKKDASGTYTPYSKKSRHIEVYFDWLPEGEVQTEEGKYDSEDESKCYGISILPYEWDDDVFSFVGEKMKSANTGKAGDYEYFILQSGDVTREFNRHVYIPLKKKNLMIQLFIGRDIAGEDLEKIIASMRVENASDDMTYWIEVYKYSDLNSKDEGTADETVEWDDVIAKKGEEVWGEGVQTVINDIQVCDKLDDFDPLCMSSYYSYDGTFGTKFMNPDSTLNEVTCRRLKAGDDNNFSEWGEVNDSRLVWVVADVTYTNKIVRDCYYTTAGLVLAEDDGYGGLQEYSDINYLYAEYGRQLRMTLNEAAYVDCVDDDTDIFRDSSSIYCLGKLPIDEPVTYKIAFLVDESEIDHAYVTINDSYNDRTYYVKVKGDADEKKK